MFPVKQFEKRFREILDALDELQFDVEDAENFAEMNSDFEDALFVIESISMDDEDWQGAFSDALEEFKDLCDGYRAMNLPALTAVADQLSSLIGLAEANLPQA